MPSLLKRTYCKCGVLALCSLLVPTAVPVQAQTAPKWTSDDFVQLSETPSPRVAYALRRDGQTCYFSLEIESLATTGIDTSTQIGLSAAKSVVLEEKDAKTTRVGNTIRSDWTIPFSSLVASPADWTKLKVAVAVTWKGGPNGADRERERFGFTGTRAAHAEFSTDPNKWSLLSLNEYASIVSERKNQVAINFSQPIDGKATVVIEDEKGARVRNFISGQPMQKGAQRLVWDGLDDDGRTMPPGNYRWRSISHAGIEPKHLLTFAAGPGSNHGILHSATNNGKWTFLGTSISEGGHDIVAFDENGEFKGGYRPILGMGTLRAALAADDKYIYLVKDGQAQYPHVDKTKPDWKVAHNISLLRIAINGGDIVDYAGGQRFAVLTSQEVGPGSATKRNPDKNSDEINMRGVALLDGKLYVSSRASEVILVFDVQNAKQVGEIKLPKPGAIAFAGNSLLALSEQKVVKIDVASNKITPVFETQLDVQGIATDKAGQIYISDGTSNTVRVFDAAGKSLRTLGKAGGAYVGPYDEKRMVNPRGLVVAPNGWLWVTEWRGEPKRYAAYDSQSGDVKHDYWGRTPYGAPGAAMDPQDPTRWVGMDSLWKLDFEKKTARPTSILGTMGADITAIHHRFVHQGDRTFLISQGKVTFIAEIQKDGSTKNQVSCGAVTAYAHGKVENVPVPLRDAFATAYPDAKNGVLTQGIGFLWVDKSGDGQMQADEFEFAKGADSFGGAYWGHDMRDLTMRFPASVGGKNVILTMAPQGFLPSGAPKYDLPAAISSAAPMETPTVAKFQPRVETTVDGKGNLIFNTDPKMTAYSPQGKLLWTYPNQWSGVHGSHNAPLPQTGEMQGALFFTGIAPLDKDSDVFAMNGNHGRLFLLTSDGLYVDELFKDLRLGQYRSESVYMMGGEAFGGTFDKSQTNGKYYLQVGGNEYRVFEVDGFDTIQRSGGNFTVTPAQAQAAENGLKRRLAAQNMPKDATTVDLSATPTIDGNDRDWPADSGVKWDKKGQFPVTARVAVDSQNLYLHYTVNDDSPWLNKGKDWQLLFKTGDSIDLQLGTDPNANPKRGGPVAGDMRLLIAPFEGKNIAVLYRHRVAGTTKPVAFTSPWRTENVDEVKQLTGAKIAVTKEANRYRVEASIPWAELGWKPTVGQHVKADFGVIYGDTSGEVNVLRNYWSNQATALVNDVPGEIMLSPNQWGNLVVVEGE